MSLERLLADSRAQGESVALATVLAGPKAGSRLLVWSAGHTYGDLGWPRLNQRVALYCEQLFEAKTKGEVSTKRFEVPGGEVEVQVELVRPA
jgi:hypothetical protein